MLTSKFERRPLGANGRGGWVVTSVRGRPAPEYLSKLRIPPAWTRVKVDPDWQRGRAVAVGYDEAGRRQYLYHPRDVADNKTAKFARVTDLLGEWEDIRTEIEAGVNAGNEEALAALLIYETGVRPGGDGDTRAQVKAYGATTLLLGHVRPAARGVRLKFVGKKGVPQNVLVTNPHLAESFLDRKRRGRPRDRLFACDVGKLRAYFRTLGSGKYKPKDFRTARGTSLALRLLGRRKLLPASQTKRKKIVNAALDKVARMLGNTRAVSRSAYVEPSIVERILSYRREEKVLKRVRYMAINENGRKTPKLGKTALPSIVRALAKAARAGRPKPAVLFWPERPERDPNGVETWVSTCGRYRVVRSKGSGIVASFGGEGTYHDLTIARDAKGVVGAMAACARHAAEREKNRLSEGELKEPAPKPPPRRGRDRFGFRASSKAALLNSAFDGEWRTAREIMVRAGYRSVSFANHVKKLISRGFVEKRGNNYRLRSQ